MEYMNTLMLSRATGATVVACCIKINDGMRFIFTGSAVLSGLFI